MTKKGIRIIEVEAGSLGFRLGLAPGDEILTVNRNPIPDELALKFYLAEELVDLEVRRPSGIAQTLRLDLSEQGALGVRVEDFRTRTCNNACLFCFIDQLPSGVRPALRIKDDDYRLSFLHGNYITLTNLPENELDRIIDQALSPLYVSVHATDPELRTRVLGRKKPDDLDRKMRKLIDGGIRLNTQIVLMPEINDGPHLEKSLLDLYAYYPGVHSVAIVPLGLSDHGTPRQHFKPVTADYCRRIIGQVHPLQERFRNEIGRTFAYLADEFYIQGEAALPETGYYDDFAQYEDGIGMVRKFLNEFDAEIARRSRPLASLSGTLATAKLFHPFLSECIERFNAKFRSRLRVSCVENRFMGRDITVAGLLSGRDFLESFTGDGIGDFLIIPNEAVSRVDGRLVDNVTPDELSLRLGKPILASGSSMKDFFRLLFERL
jgi:putative radical SAM enzyme (TIGR03279 family)